MIINTKTNHLVLLHGWGFNSAVWTSSLENFGNKYSSITTLDLNGHGENIYNPEYDNIDTYLDHLITQIPAGATILGWSLGGIIALLLLHKYPNHINNIIMCASNPCFISNNQWGYGVTPANWQEFYNKLIDNPKKTLQEFLLLQTLNYPDARSMYKKLLAFLNNTKIASKNGLNWGLNILAQDYRYLLAKINPSQITFILGRKDLLVHSGLKSWLEQSHPQIEVHYFEKSGHMPFITEPELFYSCL